MTTYSLGLGAQGKMLFSHGTYWKDTSGDFYSVATGVTADPANGICSWMASGADASGPPRRRTIRPISTTCGMLQ